MIGLDPDPFTLRKLYALAAGAFDPFARLFSFVGAAVGGKAIHPDKFNPYRLRAPKTAEQRKRDGKEALLALRTGLRTMVRRR